MTVFNRPGIIDEAAEASLALKRKIFRRDLKKPGLFLLFELILYAAVLHVGMQGISLLVIIMCNILIKAYENNPGTDVFLGLGVANFNTITSLFFNIAPTIVFLVYGRVFQGRKLRTQGFVRKNALKHYLIGLAAGAGLFFLARSFMTASSFAASQHRWKPPMPLMIQHIWMPGVKFILRK